MWWLVSMAWGATWTVDGSSNTLASAYNTASSGDTLLISPSYDASVEPGLVIEKDLSIYSAVADTTAKLPALAVVSQTVRFDDVEFVGTVTNLWDSGGTSYSCTDCSLLVESSSLPVATDLVLRDGGILLRDSTANLQRLEADNLPGNTITAIDSIGTSVLTLTVDRATIRNSGPIRAVRSLTGSGTFEVTVTDSSFTDNSGTEYAGDIDAKDLTNLTVKNSTFSGSSSSESAGSIHVEGSSATITNCTFTKTTGHDGGVLAVEKDGNPTKTLTLTSVDITDSGASQTGGAIHVKGKVVVDGTDLHIVRPYATDGGAIYASEATVELDHVGIYGADASGDGGAIYTDDGASVGASRTWICLAESGTGGGVHLAGAGNSSFVSAVFQGGDARAELVTADGHDLSLVNVTFVGLAEGTAISGSAGDLQLLNGIVHTYDVGTDASAGFAEASYTLWHNATNSVGDLGVGDEPLYDDPELSTAFSSSSCANPPFLQSSSPAVDSAHPSTEYEDPDGSPGDRGAFGGAWGQLDSEPWTRGAADVYVVLDSGIEESDPPESDPPESDPPESDPPESDPGTDTDLPVGPHTTTWVSGGCAASGALVLLFGLLLVRRR